jgi:hypothetical protein
VEKGKVSRAINKPDLVIPFVIDYCIVTILLQKIVCAFIHSMDLLIPTLPKAFGIVTINKSIANAQVIFCYC